MKEIIKVEKETNNKFLNLYHAYYKFSNDKIIDYQFSSRRSENNLVINSKGDRKIDAVRILPYYEKDGKIFVVFIKEFRMPLNKYIYSLPAGCVDFNEDALESAKRELSEEIGADVESIESMLENGYSSAGMTDENISSYIAKIKLNGEQHLEDTEDITIEIVELKDVINFINNNEFCLPSALQAEVFYYKTLLEASK